MEANISAYPNITKDLSRHAPKLGKTQESLHQLDHKHLLTLLLQAQGFHW